MRGELVNRAKCSNKAGGLWAAGVHGKRRKKRCTAGTLDECLSTGGPRRSGASACETLIIAVQHVTQITVSPACQKALAFPLVPPSAEETQQQAAHSFIHSFIYSFIRPSPTSVRPALPHTQTLTWTPSRTRSDVIASSRQTQRRRPAAGSIKERRSACVCVWGSERVCVSEGLTAQR